MGSGFISTCSIPITISELPRPVLDTITGNILGDGGIFYPNLKRYGKPTGNARYRISLGAQAKYYMDHLINSTYGPYMKAGPKA